MTTGQVTIDSAPRDLDKLAILGPFMLKTLMTKVSEKLGIEFEGEIKQAFLRDPINKRAEDVLQLLQQYDAKGGAPAPQEAPAPVAAAPAQAEPPKRQPVAKSNGTNGHGTNGVSHTALPDGMAVLANISEVLKEVSEGQKGIAAMLGEVSKALKESSTTKKEVSNLSAKVDQLVKMQHLTLGVLAQLAEQQLNAPFASILEQVAGEYGAIEPVVQGLLSGK